MTMPTAPVPGNDSPKKSSSKTKKVAIGGAAAVALLGIGGIAISGGSGDSTPAASSSSSSEKSESKKSTDTTSNEGTDAVAADEKTDNLSDADALKAAVADDGSASAAMKGAVADHVTKVNATDGSVNIYTDLTGDLMSSDTGTGELIVSATTDWAKGAHESFAEGAGLITVYNADGDILANGNY